MTQLMIFLVLKLLKVGFVFKKSQCAHKIPLRTFNSRGTACRYHAVLLNKFVLNNEGGAVQNLLL